MNQLQIFKDEQIIPVKENESGEVIVSGRNVHEFLKVQQDFSDWMKKQLEMIGANKDIEYSLLKGETSEIGGRPSTEYVLTIDTAKEICMIAGVAPRTNDETRKLSKQARQYFISIEKAWNSPEMVMKRALEIANRNIQNLRLVNEEYKTKIEEDKPKTLFADAVAVSNNTILVGELAKLLKQNGMNIGQNRLYELLRKEGYLGKSGERYNQPSQHSMDLKLFEIKKSVINNPDGSIRVTSTTKVTGKGQIYFINKFKNMLMLC